MDAAMINRWVEGLGRTYDELVGEGILPAKPLVPLLKSADNEDLIQKPILGIEMWFWAETKRLEKILISLTPSSATDSIYAGDLPHPFTHDMDQTGVRALLGQPADSRSAVKLPGGGGVLGGWDAYPLQDKTHPNARVGFTYSADMKVMTLGFALLNTGHA